MALTSQSSRRYALALVEMASRQGEAALERTKTELDSLAELMEQSFDLRNALLNPVFTVAERQKALEAVLGRMSAGDQTRRFLALCIERDRMRDLSEIAQVFRAMADERRGRVRAEVESAAPLSPEATERLRKALEKSTGKSIELEVRVDPELIGGLRARVGSLVYDGTIRTELSRLRERLTVEA